MVLADDKRPNDDECRAQLARVLASNTFIAAPQLSNFLRFAVETTLAGHGDRLKGYTIGVEALGRRADFDPQTDPIVRVEAGRLRRALARYYAGPGRDDPIVIDLPRGSCVPTFRARTLPLGLRKHPFSVRRQVYQTLLKRWRLATRVAVTVALLALAGNVTLAGLIYWRMKPEPNAAPSVSQASVQAPAQLPVLTVGLFDSAGTSEAAAGAIEKLRTKLSDALARFDEIDLASSPDGKLLRNPEIALPIRRDVYRLSASAEQHPDGTVTLLLRLQDASEGVIIWADAIEHAEVRNGAISSEDDIIKRLAPKLAQPYGVIYSREVSKARADDAPYRCLVEGFEFGRWHDSTQPNSIEECLAAASARTPAFAGLHSAMARQELRAFYRSGDRARLDRALNSARRAIALDPESARAHQMMMNVLFARGDRDAALEEGRKAIACNPWDMLVLTSYATRKLWSGEVEQGVQLLRQAEEFSPNQPPFLYFALFIGAYMQGNDAASSRYAVKLAGADTAYGMASQAIVAVRAGERDRARAEIRKLAELRPDWRNKVRLLIERYGMPAHLADRFAGDMAKAESLY